MLNSNDVSSKALASMAEASVTKPQTARGIVHFTRQRGSKRAQIA